jgi:hypothetical protein
MPPVSSHHQAEESYGGGLHGGRQMKIKVKNLGALKQAEFTLGDLTIICGRNNTGKTYATYALFGFLYTWRRIFSLTINNAEIEQLFADGVIRLDIQEYVKQAEQIVTKGCQAYTQQLPKIFASPAERFKETEFQLSLDIQNIGLTGRFELTIGSANIAEEASIKLEGKTKKTKCQTLIPADIDPELGIEARSFDTTIETMNRIQEAIVWGKE